MNKKGFQRKMAAAILVIASLGILFVSGMSYMQFRNQSIRNYINNIDVQAYIQMVKFENTMKDMYLNMTKIKCSEELKNVISSYIDSDRDFEDGEKVSKQLEKLLTVQDYRNILYLYLPQSSEMFSTQEYNSRQVVYLKNALQVATKEKEALHPLFLMNDFAGSPEYVFAYACAVTDEKTGYHFYLWLTVNEREIYNDLLYPLNKNRDGEEYSLVTSEGVVCSAENTGLLGSTRQDQSYISDSHMSAISTEDRKMLYSIQSKYTGCYILCESDLAELTTTLRSSIHLAVGVLLFSILVLAFAAVCITNQMYAPIHSLVGTMKKIQEGDFSARVTEEGMNDEFAVMAHGFNDLMDHIDQLMDHIVQERTEKREAEINALQYQIRPHFMYNTLNSIRLAAQLQRNQTLADLLGNFIELLEASIQRKGAFVTVTEEIELVEHFLKLQAFRYFDCYETEIHIAPEAEACYVPCLLMQPMVENAVFHGIDTTRNDNLIEINAWIEDQTLRISIKDNGEGFEQSQSGEDKHEKRRLTGIGLINVQDRLKLYYGDLAYYTIDSKIGEGTVVNFTLPISYDPNEYSIKGGISDR